MSWVLNATELDSFIDRCPQRSNTASTSVSLVMPLLDGMDGK